MTDSARFAKIESLFNEAIDRPPQERKAFLLARCPDDGALRRQVEVLLEADSKEHDGLESVLASGIFAGGATANAEVDDPSHIGPYRIIGRLGEGGFGVVYEAEQSESLSRRVAIKVIKPGMDSRAVIQRFDAERQTLAAMDHEGIARVFDAGSTDRGLPYFVMELVQGGAITEFCKHESIDLAGRVALMIDVSDAVRHAHARGVLHRDLKPSNVLVSRDEQGQPRVKIIDFGISKALGSGFTERTVLTAKGEFIGTPEYMSPEQAAGSTTDIDIRADVYALGALLYELLTGHPPFEFRGKSILDVVRTLETLSPQRPSARIEGRRERSAINALRRDLDWVVMRALERDRERRYAAVDEFRLDLVRFQHGEPVLAGPPSARYRVSKFVRRNKVPVALASAVTLALLAGLAGTTWGLVEANEQRRVASARAAELQLVVDLQSRQISEIQPAATGARLRDALVRAAPEPERSALEAQLSPINFTDISLSVLQDALFDPLLLAVDEQFESQPLVRARLLQSTAQTMRVIGLIRQAEASQRQALTIRREVLGDEHPDTLASMDSMGTLLNALGRFDDAERIYGEAFDIRMRTLEPGHADTLTSRYHMGWIKRQQGDSESALRISSDVLERRTQTLGMEHPDTLASKITVAGIMGDLAQFSEAESLLDDVVEVRTRELGASHVQTLFAIENLASLLTRCGEVDRAETLHRQVLEGRTEVLGVEHPDTLVSMSNLGYLLQSTGRLSEAKGLSEQVLDVKRRVLGDRHRETLISMDNLGLLLDDQGLHPEAEALFKQSLDGFRSALGPEHPNTLNSMNNLARCFYRQGDLVEAEPLFRHVVEVSKRTRGDANAETLLSMGNLGQVLEGLGKYQEAEVVTREVLEATRLSLGDDDYGTQIKVHNLGNMMVNRERFGEAVALLSESSEWARTSLSETHMFRLVTTCALGNALTYAGEFEEAEHNLLSAYSGLSETLGPTHARTAKIAAQIDRLYEAWESHDAEALTASGANAWFAARAQQATQDNPPQESRVVR